MTYLRHSKWLRFVVSLITLTLLLSAYRMITVEGEARTPKFVLMRLEDIGPGGQYASLEELGKLRTVLEYLRDQKVAYHIAVIPRWINLPPDGSRYDVPLDQEGNPYAAAFRKVLQQASDSGAVIGMHGYTHQVGGVRRDDGHHESGIGNEFQVADVEETMKASYAEPRVKAGLAIFERAGLKPQFWEGPHYRTTAEQDRVFRSYFGLNYQAEVQSHGNAEGVFYWNQRNTGYGSPTLGAAYVPTPYDYIPSNKDEKMILDRVGQTNHVASFFYHPFLEFKYLTPVLDSGGEKVVRDGLPEFRYPEQNKSVLQKLIAGLRAKGYAFHSIHDYVPFTPAQSVKLLPGGKQNVFLGDVDGDGQADTVQWNSANGEISVIPGRHKGLRNEEQPAPVRWGQAEYANGAAAAVSGKDAEGPGSFWTANPSGRLDRYVSDGRQFQLAQSWKIEAKAWSSLYTLPLSNGEVVVAGLTKDKLQLYGWRIRGKELKPIKPYKLRSEMKQELQVRMEGGPALFASKDSASGGIQLQPDFVDMKWKLTRVDLDLPNEDGLIRLGDFNGDGREDALRWDPKTMSCTVYLRDEDQGWKLLSTFGPWGTPGSGVNLTIRDVDGNGKADLVLIDRTSGTLDFALSYQSK
ncbi:hypothetical protein SAMN04487970_104925 [Paenibacillus tianmuensis]|uniref:Repeat domain-containing protein n=1 Tax=Paenibacillus tianmuensis TaxID=624147 RepID=A0A1G4TE06_9BACL|nr:DUF2334 domain-containing protein [Paenibacillus tianmuensis]SCW79606.1 hypothetical protein SAMN04487970_104925 [Paenibacillus tianmuensis]